MNFNEVFLLLTLFVVTFAEYKSYNNYKVYKAEVKTESDVEVLKLMNKIGWDFWTDQIAVDGDVRVMVAPEKQKEFEDILTVAGIFSQIIIQDVQELIDEQLRRPATARQNDEYGFDYYMTLDEINEWIESFAQKHPNIVSVITSGLSFEEKEIKGLKIDHKKQDSPTIGMIEAGIHAREWIAPATALWIIKEFVESNDPEVRFLGENVVWHVFPVVNPDGYQHSFTHNRMWRKNRNTANHISCSPWGIDDDLGNGIDLNRNFDFIWNTTGTIWNPCAETFPGAAELSEPESRAIANYVRKLQQEGNLLYYFSFHSFSQMILLPYSHLSGSDVLEAHNYADMYEIAIKGTDALRAKHGTEYRVGTAANILYETSGATFDWVHGVANVPIAMLFELRDLGLRGFLLDREDIIPNNEEIIAALVEMDKVTRQLGYYEVVVRSNSNRFHMSLILLVLAALSALFLFV